MGATVEEREVVCSGFVEGALVGASFAVAVLRAPVFSVSADLAAVLLSAELFVSADLAAVLFAPVL